MRLNKALSTIISTLAWAPGFSRAFFVSPSSSRAVTTLAARRHLLPTLRRPSFFFPDVDRMFEEMDEMMESSLATFPRSSLSLLDRNVQGDLNLKRPLGFEVTQDENEYKVAMSVPDLDAQDLDLSLDPDGRVLRLKGERKHEDGGMKFQSRFEKAILLNPNVDTTKLAANMSGDTLTIVAPKVEKTEALGKPEAKKIDIHFEEPKAALQEGEASTDAPPVATRLAVENVKQEKVETGTTAETSPEKKWPARDFPY